MTDLVVLNNLPWTPPVASKLLKMPELKIDVRFADSDLKEMGDKQRQSFDQEFKKFDAEFHKLGTAKIKAVQDAVKWTEERILKKEPKERQNVVDTANQLLKQAFATFQNEIATLAQKWYDAALAKSQKVMKLRMTKAKAKAISKIVVLALLVLTTAGLTIAAAVVTGGAAVPLALGAIATGAKALYSIYGTYQKHWVTAEGQIKVIQGDIATLQKNTDVLQKYRLREAAAPDSTSIKGQVKKVVASVDGSINGLDKHVGQLEKFVFATRTGLKEQQKTLAQIKPEADKDPKLKLTVVKTEESISSSQKQLEKMSEIVTQARTVRDAWSKEQKVIDLGRLGPLLNELSSAGGYVSEVGNGIKALLKAVGK